MVDGLYEHQKEMLTNMLEAWSQVNLCVLLCARRLGKTHLLLWYANHVALRTAGAKIKYAAATAVSLRDFSLPIMTDIANALPDGERPTWKASEDAWIYPNGSRITMVGCDDKRKADRLRGPACHLAIVDEAAFISVLTYVVESVLRFQLLTTDGVMVLASSAPESPDHPFAQYVRESETKGTVIKRTIHQGDPRHITRAKIESFAEEMGGMHTTTWRREMECEIVIDDSRAVLPEIATAALDVFREPEEVPEHAFRYTAIDVGHIDMTVAAIGCVDYMRQTLLVLDEVALHHKTSREIAQAVLDQEGVRWGQREVRRRGADASAQTIADLRDGGLQCMMLDKRTKNESITYLRDLIGNRQIIVHPRCRTITAHMKSAVWNSSRKDFERREAQGLIPGHHYDGVDAVRYLADMADFQTDPRPRHGTFSEQVWGGTKQHPLMALTKGRRRYVEAG